MQDKVPILWRAKKVNNNTKNNWVLVLQHWVDWETGGPWIKAPMDAMSL